MSGGSGRIRTGGGYGKNARVGNERLWVDAVISSGGGGVAANVTIVGPLPVPVDIVSSITLDTNIVTSVPISVTGTVSIAGQPIGVDVANSVPIDVASIIPGTGATNLGKAEDAAHASGDVGVMSLAVRQDTQTALAANGDYIPLSTDALGRLRVLAVEPYTILPLSSSTNGQPIVVDGIVFGTIHTVAASVVDVITIFATNVGTTDRTIFIGFGGTATGQQIWAFVPAQETVCVVSEMPLNASQVVQARLNIAGTCRVVGRVTRRSV